MTSDTAVFLLLIVAAILVTIIIICLIRAQAPAPKKSKDAFAIYNKPSSREIEIAIQRYLKNTKEQ